MKCKLLATCFLAASGFANAQIFYSEEEFYGYLEHRARMALIEAEARACHEEHLAFDRQKAREREHQKVMEAVDEELDRQTLENIEWLRTHPSSFR